MLQSLLSPIVAQAHSLWRSGDTDGYSTDHHGHDGHDGHGGHEAGSASTTEAQSPEDEHTHHVTFSRKVGMVCTDHLNDCTQREIESMWYTKDELQTMRAEAETFVNTHKLAAKSLHAA